MNGVVTNVLVCQNWRCTAQTAEDWSQVDHDLDSGWSHHLRSVEDT